MGISFGSINSGLPKDIVKQIIAAEKIPIQKMEERKSKIADKKGLVDQLQKLVEDIRGEVFKNRTSRSLRELKVETNDKIVDVSIDKNLAEPGNYQLEVMEMAQKSSAISNGVEDKDKTYIGVGYIEYELPDGETKEVFVDPENSSLSGIAKLINKDSSSGMRATVINDGSGSDTPWRLIISLKDTGDINSAEFPNLYFVDGEVDLNFENERKAQNAKVKLDGFEIELPANKASELIPGVSIDLKKAKPGEEFSINITEDTKAISGKLTSLIEKTNALIGFIKQQNTMNESTDTSRTLGGDITLQTLESRLRSAIFKPIMTDFGQKRLSDIGIEFQRDGLLKYDSARFENELANNYELVSQVITGKFTEGGKTDGAIDHLADFVESALRMPNGIIKTRQDGLQRNIDRIDTQISDKQRNIERKEEILKAKFARLEETISRIQAQGAGLASLGSSGVNPVTQLG